MLSIFIRTFILSSIVLSIIHKDALAITPEALSFNQSLSRLRKNFTNYNDHIQSKRIIGGSYLDLQTTATALVTDDQVSFICTGTLVGPNVIVTAAHCLSSSNEYFAIIGELPYKVNDAWINGSYVPNGPLSYNVAYDVAILLLEKSVAGTVHVPIVYDLPLYVGDPVTVLGYGMTEVPYDNTFEKGKYAHLKVSNVQDGYIKTVYSSSGAATCSGDSGGPLIHYIGEYPVLVGVTSQGTNTNDGARCFYSGDGVSLFTNLQSTTSQGFLSNFTSLSRVSGRKLYVFAGVEIIVEGTPTTTSQSKRKLLQYLTRVRTALKQLASFALGEQLILINKARRKAFVSDSASFSKRQVTKKVNQTVIILNSVLSVSIS